MAIHPYNPVGDVVLHVPQQPKRKIGDVDRWIIDQWGQVHRKAQPITRIDLMGLIERSVGEMSPMNGKVVPLATRDL